MNPKGIWQCHEKELKQRDKHNELHQKHGSEEVLKIHFKRA